MFILKVKKFYPENNEAKIIGMIFFVLPCLKVLVCNIFFLDFKSSLISEFFDHPVVTKFFAKSVNKICSEWVPKNEKRYS
jgi:hypothetical protein